MNKKSQILIFVLSAAVIFLLYDKVTTQPVMVQPVKQEQTSPADVSGFEASLPAKKTNHECLIAAENFFESKRASDIDLYSATWNEYYEESSGMCFVEIKDITYEVKSGDVYHLVNGVMTKSVK